MGKMHDRLKAAGMRVSAIDINELEVSGSKEYFITFFAAGLKHILTSKTSKDVTEERVKPLATLFHDLDQLRTDRDARKKDMKFQAIARELRKVCAELDIDDTQEAVRVHIQKHLGDLLNETIEETQRFTINEFAKQFTSTPSQPGNTIVASGMGGPMFDGMDMSRFMSKKHNS